jgi:hypothetical protein
VDCLGPLPPFDAPMVPARLDTVRHPLTGSEHRMDGHTLHRGHQSKPSLCCISLLVDVHDSFSVRILPTCQTTSTVRFHGHTGFPHGASHDTFPGQLPCRKRATLESSPLLRERTNCLHPLDAALALDLPRKESCRPSRCRMGWQRGPGSFDRTRPRTWTWHSNDRLACGWWSKWWRKRFRRLGCFQFEVVNDVGVRG